MSPERSGPKWKVGTERRLTVSMTDFPGPGTYESNKDSSQPSYSMTARRPSTSGSTVPGPGTYSPKDKHSTISFSVGNAPRDPHVGSIGPGPASYSIPKHSSKAAVFGSSQRNFSIAHEANPGPGAYEIKTSRDGPKYSLRKKNEDRSKQDVPVFFT